MGFLRNHFPSNESSPAGDDVASLVARARQGDSQAFAFLYRRYLDRVFDFAYRRLGSREAAEDATQTIFLRAASSIGQSRDDAAFAGWLFAIARNVVNDSYRSRRHEGELLEETPDFEDPAATPEELVIGAEWHRELTALRQRCLSDGERELLDLRLHGLNDREIAVALGKKHGAVRTAQYRMILKLRECMHEDAARKESTHVAR